MADFIIIRQNLSISAKKCQIVIKKLRNFIWKWLKIYVHWRSGLTFWYVIPQRDVIFVSRVPILKAHKMNFPTNLLSQKSINVLQTFRHNYLNTSIFDEISKEIYIVQIIMTKSLQCVDGFLRKWASWKGHLVGFQNRCMTHKCLTTSMNNISKR
jgi:hypothetical protein